MTFCGGRIAVGGFDTGGRGSGVDIWSLGESLDPLRDFLRDLMWALVGRGGGRKERMICERRQSGSWED